MSRQPSPLKIVAYLDGPFAGAVPKLDAIVEYCAAAHHPNGLPRGTPIPREQVGTLPIPLVRREVCGYRVPACSAGIIAVPLVDTHEHFCRSIASEDFSDCNQRIKIATTGGEHRSYRLPLRIRLVPSIVWFAVGWRAPLLKELRGVTAIGKKPSHGFGRVQSWEVTEWEHDWSWFAPVDGGTLLMRPLPAETPNLPADLVGYRKWHGGVVPPYWQQDLFCAMVEPC